MKFIVGFLTFTTTIVGILTFISRMNTTSESLTARKVFIVRHFTSYQYLKFHAELSLSAKKGFITSGPGL